MNEWEDEPNREEFVHAELPCLILRGPMKALCGYTGVPPSHPAYGKDYNEMDVDVHGGLTFSRLGGHNPVYVKPTVRPSIEPPEPGSPEMIEWLEETGQYLKDRSTVERWEPNPDCKWAEGFWWFGFDCAHFMDYVPGLDDIPGLHYPHLNEVYRNWAWVKSETQRLAEQLAAMTEIPDYNEWLQSVKKGGKQ